ncbi:glycosyltransferase [Microbulbifer sediminum]|uniref:glycosyltransferase n=1 Tax=Microbulbifer sediminum TaxID=2904250 RepID=UPI001F1883EB|nr:glycosyltransferase [Microbulbifer sediminum]
MPEAPIAYLAPEIPGLSSTFVYKEIFLLEETGIKVEPFSIHPTAVPNGNEKLESLAGRTFLIYGQGIGRLVRSHLSLLLSNPRRYWRTLRTVLGDARSAEGGARVAWGLCYRAVLAPVLAREMMRRKVTHLHVHFAHVSTDIGMYASMLTGIPFSITAHANDLFQRGYLLDRKADRAAFLATISRFNLRWLQERGVAAGKLRLVRCGVDSREFAPRPHSPRNKPVRFGFLARIVEKKGLDLLVDACALLKARGLRFRLDVAGDGPLQAQVQRQAVTAGLETEVRFLGAMQNCHVGEWLGQLDCLVLPCRKDSAGDMDGIPVVLMEAMLSGVPVISTSVSGVPELVIDQQTGLVAEPEAQSIADAMHALIEERPEITDTRIWAARKLVADEFDIHRNTMHLMDLIDAARASRSQPGSGHTGMAVS